MTGNGRAPRRILHTSDIHIRTLGDVACRSLEAVTNTARQTGVDLIIIAGDLFDHNRVDDDVITFTAEALQSAPARVVILPGNHDYLCEISVYERDGFWQGKDNINIFREPAGEIMAFPEVGISIWGKPIPTTDDIRPMEGLLPPVDEHHWYIAVAHGYFVDTEPPLFPSYHIRHEEVSAGFLDYVALGHVPVYRCASETPVKTFYSGQPFHSHGTVNIVDFDEATGITVARHPLTD